MITRISIRRTTFSALMVALLWSLPVDAQTTRQREEMRRRAAEEFQRERVARFVEDVHRFYETSGELVAFRVYAGMSDGELRIIENKSKELDDRASRIISFITNIIPEVKGNTDNLWVIPPADEPSLEDRLTLILALVYRVEPKLQHLIELLSGEIEPAIEVDQLMVEASLPFLIVGGLEVIKSLSGDLRRAL